MKHGPRGQTASPLSAPRFQRFGIESLNVNWPEARQFDCAEIRSDP